MTQTAARLGSLCTSTVAQDLQDRMLLTLLLRLHEQPRRHGAEMGLHISFLRVCCAVRQP